MINVEADRLLLRVWGEVKQLIHVRIRNMIWEGVEYSTEWPRPIKIEWMWPVKQQIKREIRRRINETYPYQYTNP